MQLLDMLDGVVTTARLGSKSQATCRIYGFIRDPSPQLFNPMPFRSTDGAIAVSSLPVNDDDDASSAVASLILPFYTASSTSTRTRPTIIPAENREFTGIHASDLASPCGSLHRS